MVEKSLLLFTNLRTMVSRLAAKVFQMMLFLRYKAMRAPAMKSKLIYVKLLPTVKGENLLLNKNFKF